MKKRKILLFIPVFNCEKQILRVLNQITPEVGALIDFVIVVNNLSTDKTEESVLDYFKGTDFPCNFALLRNHDNYSLGGSHKVAFNYAIKNGFDYIIVLHGDDQGNMNDLLPYINNSLIEEYDSLLGSRFSLKSKLVNYSKFRIFGNYCLNIFISFLVFHKISDLGSGLNLYKTNYLKNKFYLTFPNNLTFNVYMLLYGLYAKSKFRFFPLTWKEEDQVSNAKLFSQTKEIIGLAFRYLINPGKLFSSDDNAYSRMKYESDVVFLRTKE